MKEEHKKKFNKKALIVVLLTLYLLIMAFYYVFTLPIRSIEIKGNKLISDGLIIEAAGIKDYPKIALVSHRKVKKNVEKISEIDSVKIRKSLTGKITIEVKEANTLFYDVLKKKYVLANGKYVDDVTVKEGIPTFINYTTKEIYEKLIKKMAKIDPKIISLISEIEYSPDIKNNITLDENRFFLRMNDGNHVYINLANFDNLNKYELIYAALEDKGILNLDSIYSGSTNIPFKSFNATPVVVEEEPEGDGDETELSE